MKAVVLEIQDGVAAVLTEDGTVEKVRRECMVGETIELDAVMAARPTAASRATAAQDANGMPSASAVQDPTAAPRVTAAQDVNGMPSASAVQDPTAARDVNAHKASARRALHHHARRWIATAAAVLIVEGPAGGCLMGVHEIGRAHV